MVAINLVSLILYIHNDFKLQLSHTHDTCFKCVDHTFIPSWRLTWSACLICFWSICLLCSALLEKCLRLCFKFVWWLKAINVKIMATWGCGSHILYVWFTLDFVMDSTCASMEHQYFVEWIFCSDMLLLVWLVCWVCLVWIQCVYRQCQAY